jgi:acylphosphatase
MLQKKVCFSGRVQGVGFRYTTARIAGSFSVAGYVRNMPDGRVELVVEGEEKEISAFLDGIGKAMGGYISGISDENLPATGEFGTFDIRF